MTGKILHGNKISFYTDVLAHAYKGKHYIIYTKKDWQALLHYKYDDNHKLDHFPTLWV